MQLSLAKRIVFYVFVILALGGALWGYFHLKETKKPSLKAEDLLPDSAACLFSSHSFNELYSKLSSRNLVWNEAVNIAEFLNVNASIHFFDSVITENEYLDDFFKQKKIFLALYNGKSDFNSLIIFNLDDLAQEKEFVEAIKTAFKNSGTEEQLQLHARGKTWYAKVTQGVVTLSDRNELIVKAFGDTKRRLKDNAAWNALSKLHTENELLAVYANHRLLNATTRDRLDLSETILTGHSLATWEIRPDELSVNGFNLPDSSSRLNMLAFQQAQACDFLSVLPFNTTSFTAYGFHDFMSLRKKIKIERSDFWKAVNDSSMFNAEQEFYNNIGTKLIELTIQLDKRKAKALVMEVRDTSKTAELLTYVSDTIVNTREIKTGRLNKNIGDLVSASFGELSKVESEIGIVYDRYFIVADSTAGSYLMSSLQNNSSLLQNEMFANYAKENLGLNFNYLYYCVPKKHPEYTSGIFPFLKEGDLKHFEKFTDFSICASNYKTMLQFRMDIKYQQDQENKDVPGLWTFEGDTLLQPKVALFTNHKSGDNEVVLGDMKGNLYLLNATGNPLWKKQLKEPLMSDVYTVDAFKNNKYQLLFNTRNYLYLVDRNGKDVEGFPVKLPASATSALTLFDYDGTKDYRLFIACDDKRIYNYGINGIKNEKFTPVKTDAPVSLPLKYMKVAGSDYLVTADVQGKMYLFSRRGEERINFKNKMTQGCRAFYADASGSLQTSRLIYVDDKNSLLESISLTDKKEVVKLNSEFDDASYTFDLVDDDKKADLIIFDRTHAKIFDLSGNEIFSHSDGDLNEATYFYDADGTFFLLGTSDQLQVLDVSSKKIIKKFPATGKPLITDLFKDGKKYILVAEGKTLKCVILK